MITSNNISDNLDDGIDIDYVGEGEGGDPEVIISENEISNNTNTGVEIKGMDEDNRITVSPCNDIFDNEDYGVYNFSGYEVDATGNWWGDDSGPDGEGPGNGDSVTEDVDFRPWLTTPCGEEVLDAAFDAESEMGRAPVITGEAPLTVWFQDKSTGTIEERLWNFGDGGTSTAKNPSHIYSFEGNFTVSLTVTGPGGEDTARKEVLVDSAAVAAKLTVRDLRISETYAQPRQELAVDAKVVNEGGSWGSSKVDLLINGRYEQSANIGVAPGTAQPIRFIVYKVEAGEYAVTIGEATGTFFVQEEEERPAPAGVGLLAGGELDTAGIIAIIVIGIMLALMFTRQR
jgi:hypothetical protein